MSRRPGWDTELYEASHSFVWMLGEDLVSMLAPRPGERILDLGCGTGQLTAAIAKSGSSVLGFDASPDMIGQARQNYPRLEFMLGNAYSLPFENEFDGIFSNAALHWMTDAEAVALNMVKAMRRGGRLVAELGGKGNVRVVEQALRSAIAGHLDGPPASIWYFPSLADYAALLEKSGLEVRLASLFDRPTALTGEHGMEQWIRQFAFEYLAPLSPEQKRRTIEAAVNELRPLLWDGKQWHVDYRRLRIVAVKP